MRVSLLGRIARRRLLGGISSCRGFSVWLGRLWRISSSGRIARIGRIAS